MLEEKMTQDEIDALMRSITSGEMDDPVNMISGSSLDPVTCRNRYSAVCAAKSRYEYALENGSFDDKGGAEKPAPRRV